VAVPRGRYQRGFAFIVFDIDFGAVGNEAFNDRQITASSIAASSVSFNNK
jgi:hypothetical protein